MKLLLALLVALSCSVSFASDDIIGFKLGGDTVTAKGDLTGLVKEFEKLIADEDYDVESGLCVVYGEEGDTLPGDKFDSLLNDAGFYIQLEGIYGEGGNHMFEVYHSESREYIGAIAGIYPCK